MPSSLIIYAFALASLMIAGNARQVEPEPAGDGILGLWEGAVVREGSVQIMQIEFIKAASSLAGTFSIPELGLFREPLTDVSFQPPKLEFRMLYGTFAAELHDDLEEIVGSNDRWGPPVRLHLKKTSMQQPWRYKEVQFKNGSVVLAGTLVLPASAGPHPAAVVVHGSHPQGRHDGKDAWVYRGWGEALASRGVAALVYDKRGIGESTGDYLRASLDDLADDALAGVEMLRAHTLIDPQRVGVIGTSQGGWIAPIAAVKDRAVAFLILQVPPAVSVAEQEMDTVAASLSTEEAREAGISVQHIAEAQAFQRAMFEVAYGRRSWAGFEPEARKASETPWAKFIEIPKSEADLDWWRRNEFDPAPTLRQVRCPVLALFGKEDPLVPPARNVPLLERCLREGGNTDYVIRVFPGVGHNCEMPRRLTGDDWGWPASFWVWARKAPGFYQQISDWLRAEAIVR